MCPALVWASQRSYSKTREDHQCQGDKLEGKSPRLPLHRPSCWTFLGHCYISWETTTWGWWVPEDTCSAATLETEEIPPPLSILELLCGASGDYSRASGRVPSFSSVLHDHPPRAYTQPLSPTKSISLQTGGGNKVVSSFFFDLSTCSLASMLRWRASEGQSRGSLAQTGTEGAFWDQGCWLLHGAAGRSGWGGCCELSSEPSEKEVTFLCSKTAHCCPR